MKYNPETMQLEGKVEIPRQEVAKRIMNDIVWGDTHYNPNRKEKNHDK